MCFKIFSFKNFILAGVGILMVEESRVSNTIAFNEMHRYLLGFNIFSKETDKASTNVLPKIFSISDILTTVRPSVSIEKIHETAHNPFKSPTIKPRASRSRAGSFNSKLRPETLERELEVISSPSIPLEEGSKSITSPVFKHFNQLRETAYFLKTLFQIDAHTDLQISSTAFYNPSKNAVIITDPSVSHLASAIKSPSTIELLTIGGKNIPRENITILESSAVERQSPKLISSRSGKRNSQMGSELLEFRLNKAENSISDNFRRSTIDFGHNGSIELIDISLYQSPLESFGTKWVPIIASITDQLSKNQTQPLIPEFHLFNGISVQRGLAREISTIGSTTVIFENYNKHAYLNPGFLKDVFPLKLTRPMYSTLSEAELFITQAGLRELDYSQGVIPHFGDLIIAAEFRVNKNGVINKFFVHDNSNLASVLKDSKKVSVLIGGNEISKIEFSSSGESFLGKPLNSLIGPKKEGLYIPLTELNPWSLTNAFNMEFSQRLNSYLNSFKTRGIIAVLEHRPTGSYPNLVTHFYPVLEEFVIYINSKLINSTAFLTVDTPKGSISRYVPFIPSIEHTTAKLPASPELLSPTLETFTPRAQSIILTRNTPFSELSTEVTSYNIRLSPIFEDFGELSSVSEHLFSMIHKLEHPKEKTFVRIKPVALYHPSKNRVVILEGSLLERHHMTLQSENLSLRKSIKFTNGFKHPKISVYKPKDFKELLAGEKTISSLELNSFNKSPYYIYNESWNTIFIGIENDSYSSAESITLGLFKEAKLFSGIFTREFQYNKKNWSYELLSKEMPQRSFPLFNSHDHLVFSVKPLRSILNISEKEPINISAFYNPSSNSLVASNPEKYLFGKLLESLKISDGSTLTIGQREVPFDNIIFAKGDALSHLLNKNTPNFTSKIIQLEDASLFSNTLESHGDSWVPVMFRLGEQNIEKTSFPINPEVYLFDKFLIYRGIGKELLSTIGNTTITLENYTRHLFMNPYFLRGSSNSIVPRGTHYPSISTLKPFLLKASLMEHNLSEGAKPHLGELIPSGFFEYTPDGNTRSLIISENSKFAKLLTMNSNSKFTLFGNNIHVIFSNYDYIASEGFHSIRNESSQIFIYTIDYARFLKKSNSLPPNIRLAAFFEHSSSQGQHQALRELDFPVYSALKGFNLDANGITNQLLRLSETITTRETTSTIDISYISRNKSFFSNQRLIVLNVMSPENNTLKPNMYNELTPIFKNFEELSVLAESNYKNFTKSKNSFKITPFIKIIPVGIYQKFTGEIGILEDSYISSLLGLKRNFMLKHYRFTYKIIFFSQHRFTELLRGHPLANFIDQNPTLIFNDWIPILAELKSIENNVFFPSHTIPLVREVYIGSSSIKVIR